MILGNGILIHQASSIQDRFPNILLLMETSKTLHSTRIFGRVPYQKMSDSFYGKLAMATLIQPTHLSEKLLGLYLDLVVVLLATGAVNPLCTFSFFVNIYNLFWNRFLISSNYPMSFWNNPLIFLNMLLIGHPLKKKKEIVDIYHQSLFVANLEEASHLRRQGIRHPTLYLTPFAYISFLV